MIRAFISKLRGLHSAIRHDDAITATTCDDERLAILADHCRYLLGTEASAWIPQGKRREIVADLRSFDPRDDYERTDATDYLERVGAYKP